MPVNLSSIVQNALAAAAKAGLTGALSVTRATGTVVDPLTGTATGRSGAQTITQALAMTPQQLRGRSNVWLEASVVVMVAANDLEWTPSINDLATWAGRTGAITAMQLLAPAGTVVAYELAVGA